MCCCSCSWGLLPSGNADVFCLLLFLQWLVGDRDSPDVGFVRIVERGEEHPPRRPTVVIFHFQRVAANRIRPAAAALGQPGPIGVNEVVEVETEPEPLL